MDFFHSLPGKQCKYNAVIQNNNAPISPTHGHSHKQTINLNISHPMANPIPLSTNSLTTTHQTDLSHTEGNPQLAPTDVAFSLPNQRKMSRNIFFYSQIAESPPIWPGNGEAFKRRVTSFVVTHWHYITGVNKLGDGGEKAQKSVSSRDQTSHLVVIIMS